MLRSQWISCTKCRCGTSETCRRRSARQKPSHWSQSPVIFQTIFNIFINTITCFRAIVERPDSVAQIVDLVDTGVGADTVENDGIYSRYFPAVQQQGRYTITCYVNSSSSTYIDDGKSQQMRTAVGSFNRVASGGSFRVITLSD